MLSKRKLDKESQKKIKENLRIMQVNNQWNEREVELVRMGMLITLEGMGFDFPPGWVACVLSGRPLV